MIQCLFLISKVLAVIRTDYCQELSSEYVQINVIELSYVVFGYMEASYQFLWQLRNGRSGQGEISRRLQADRENFS